MPRLLLDTTVLIDALRGKASAERLRALRSKQPYLFLNNQSNLIEMLSNTPGVGNIDLQITQLDEIAQPFAFN